MEAKMIIDKVSGKIFIQHPDKEERERAEKTLVDALRRSIKADREFVQEMEQRRGKTMKEWRESVREVTGY